MKRISILVLVLMVLTTSAVTYGEVGGTVTRAEVPEEISLILNGTPLNFDTPPQVVDGRTLVPVRKVLEALGSEVSWVGEENKVIAKNKEKTMVLWLDQKAILVDGTTHTIDVAPQIINNRTYIPVRAAAELLDSSVHWDGENKTIIILNQELTERADELNTLFSDKGQLPTDLELSGTLEILNKGLSVLKGNLNLDFADSFSNAEDILSNFNLNVDMGYTKGVEAFKLTGDIFTSEMAGMHTLDINLLFNQNNQTMPIVYSMPIDESTFNLEEVTGMEDSLSLIGPYIAPYTTITTTDTGDIEYIMAANQPMIAKMMSENTGEYKNLDFAIKAYDNGGDSSLDKISLHFEGDLPAEDSAFRELELSEDIEGINTVLFSATIKLN